MFEFNKLCQNRVYSNHAFTSPTPEGAAPRPSHGSGGRNGYIYIYIYIYMNIAVCIEILLSLSLYIYIYKMAPADGAPFCPEGAKKCLCSMFFVSKKRLYFFLTFSFKLFCQSRTSTERGSTCRWSKSNARFLKRTQATQLSFSGYSAEGGAVDEGCSGWGQYYVINQYTAAYESLHPSSTTPPFAECGFYEKAGSSSAQSR